MGMLSVLRKMEGMKQGLVLIEDIAEGDVEGVMDRPIGNTTDVYAECEKWYAPLSYTRKCKELS